METINSITPVIVIFTSLVATFLIFFTGEMSRNLREAWSIIAAVIKFGFVVSMLPPIFEGKMIEYTLISIAPGLKIHFKVDALGILFAILASFLWIITSFYSIGYMRSLNEHAQTRYFCCFAIALSATMGVALSGNMFTTFLFYEIITLSTYPLVAHKETPEALQGARRYITYLLGTSIAFQLTAVFLTYSMAGTLDFTNEGLLHNIRERGISDLFITVTFFLYMAGITKAAMMPLHSWLPAAMVAPTPVSALLHAVAVVKTGVFMVLRVVLHIFGIDLLKSLDLGIVLTVIASFTIIAGSIMALRQDNLKLRLAYSTVSQLSYIVLGVALLTPSGITGSIMHIVAHAFGKITLFFTAGAIYVATHKTKISELDGIGRQMPFTMAAFTVGALSMIGIPPFAGFISKWYLSLGALEAGDIFVLGVLATSTILNACYFMPIVYVAFMKEPKPDPHHHEHSSSGIHEAPVFAVAPLVLTAIGTVLIFFYPSLFLEIIKIIVANVIGGN